MFKGGYASGNVASVLSCGAMSQVLSAPMGEFI